MTTTTRTILLIVESPQKASKIQSLLAGAPDTWIVAATVGHIADIPERESGIDRPAGFEPRYEVTQQGEAVVADLRSRLAGVDAVVLGTDGDREGEVIAQHVVDFVIRPVRPELLEGMQRVTFDPISADGVRAGLASPRSIDAALVESAKARRVVDRLFGYDLSDVARRKVNRAATGGRTQSPALRMVVDRERERIAFVPASYWTIEAGIDGHPGSVARSVSVDGLRIVTAASHLDGSTPLHDRVILSEEDAVRGADSTHQLVVVAREETVKARPPKEPYRNSTLIQDANTRLGMSVAQAKAVGEQLRNAGFITYVRTDSSHLSAEAAAEIRDFVAVTYGSEHLGDATTSAATGAVVQGAHEAVRPTDIALEVPEGMDERAVALYTMIRQRTLASQMAPAILRTTTVTLHGGGAEYRMSATTVDVPGHLLVMPEREDGDEPGADLHGLDVETVVGVTCEAVRHETKPPARYTEASLIKALEDKGIGRPSTYGDIVSKLLGRSVWQDGGSRGPLIPRLSAFAMAALLETHFAEWVDDDYTTRLEQSLDGVAKGAADRATVVSAFMNGGGAARGFATAVDAALASRDTHYVIGLLGTDPATGESVALMAGRAFGTPPTPRPYVQSGTRRASVPDDMERGAVTLEYALERLSHEHRDLGTDPDTGLPVVLRNGAHGPYVQLGADLPRSRGAKASTPAGVQKPLIASIPVGTDSATLDLGGALTILHATHRMLGVHPETGLSVWLSIGGRYGKTSHYVRCGDETRTVKDDPDSVDLAGALALLATPKPPRRGKRPATRR